MLYLVLELYVLTDNLCQMSDLPCAINLCRVFDAPCHGNGVTCMDMTLHKHPCLTTQDDPMPVALCVGFPLNTLLQDLSSPQA